MKHRRSAAIVGGVAWAVAILVGEGGTLAARCVAGNEVRLTAQELTAKPPAYAFILTNLSRVSVSGLVIGRRETVFSIFGVPANVPVRIGSPTGWSGRHVPVEESFYLYYVWQAMDQARYVEPGQSVAGFRIDLPDVEGVHLGRLGIERLCRSTSPASPSRLRLLTGHAERVSWVSTN